MDSKLSSSQYVGLDVGQSKTGLARASAAARLAEPLSTVPTEEVLKTLKDMFTEQESLGVVVGLPRNLSGQDTDQTRWVRDWVSTLKPQLPKAHFYWQDEALTSKLAAEQKTKNVSEDAQAAAIILQDFLDSDGKEEV